MKLLEIPTDRTVRIARIAAASDVAGYLRAVGIDQGTCVRVLRRAPFGGPILLRASTGADVAIDADVAVQIEIEDP